jgi:precorrin-3B C17-methyltransferase
MVQRINEACKFFPCHKELEDCVFCFCPLFPCKDESKGSYIKIGKKRIWDCSECDWIHKKETVDRIFKLIRQKLK